MPKNPPCPNSPFPPCIGIIEDSVAQKGAAARLKMNVFGQFRGQEENGCSAIGVGSLCEQAANKRGPKRILELVEEIKPVYWREI